MVNTEKSKLIIELETEHPEILKDDIQEVVKHIIIAFQILSEIFPPPAIKDTKKVLKEILESVNP